MGETRPKRARKRSVKATQGKSNAKPLLVRGDGARISPAGSSALLSYFADLDINSEVPTTSITRSADPTLLDIRKTPGRGIGVFAARKIPAGTLVIAEAPLVRLMRAQEHSLNGDDEELKESSVKQQYTSLPISLCKSYDKLFDTEKPQFSRSKSIFYSNCYNLDQHSEHGGACIGLLASRINHACSGHNVQFSFADDACLETSADHDLTDESESANSSRASIDSQQRSGLMLMHATKDILKGKELLSNYLSPYLVSQARQNELQMHYKFTCDCSACMQQGFWADSDERRSQMRRLKADVERSDEAYVEVTQAPRKGDPGQTDLVALQEGMRTVETLTKLANLLTKEGLNGYDLVLVYQNLARWSFRNGDHIAARRWTVKAREMGVICFGRRSKWVADIDRVAHERGIYL